MTALPAASGPSLDRAPRTTCPVCRHAVEVPASYVGKRWRCPDCGTRLLALPGRASEAIDDGGAAPPTHAQPAHESAPRGYSGLDLAAAALFGALVSAVWFRFVG